MPHTVRSCRCGAVRLSGVWIGECRQKRRRRSASRGSGCGGGRAAAAAPASSFPGRGNGWLSRCSGCCPRRGASGSTAAEAGRAHAEDRVSRMRVHLHSRQCGHRDLPDVRSGSAHRHRGGERRVSRLSRFEDYRYIGAKDTMRVYDCDDTVQFDELSERIELDRLVERLLVQSFAPDSLDEARNRGFRRA